MKRAENKHVFLTGFMGTGKSTVGKLLADLLSCAFVDLDEALVQQQKRSIAEIFARDGENYFRDCESALLAEIPLQPPAVYATGGGVVIRQENRLMMQKLGSIVYLRSRWFTLKNRLMSSVNRPLVDTDNGWQQVAQLWSDRQPLYEEASFVVDTDDLTPLQVARKVVAGLTV